MSRNLRTVKARIFSPVSAVAAEGSPRTPPGVSW